MVIRPNRSTHVPSEAQARKAAQRKLAKEIKSGTYKPSSIGSKAREAARNYRAEKTRIINLIRQYKNTQFDGSEKFNQRHSDKYARTNPITGKEWTIDQLRKILNAAQRAAETDEDVFDMGDLADDIESAFYYH